MGWIVAVTAGADVYYTDYSREDSSTAKHLASEVMRERINQQDPEYVAVRLDRSHRMAADTLVVAMSYLEVIEADPPAQDTGRPNIVLLLGKNHLGEALECFGEFDVNPAVTELFVSDPAAGHVGTLAARAQTETPGQ